MIESQNKRLCFYYDDVMGTFSFAPGHPMKPFRLPMVYDLLKGYGIQNQIDYFDSELIEGYFEANGFDQMLTKYHSDDYIELIKLITPENKHQYEDQLYRCKHNIAIIIVFNKDNFGEDCPVMDRLYDFCTLYAGASVVGANFLNSKKYDVVVNYSGGLHHAKQSEASGFCYVNDVVLGILELLKVHQRVMYIDIDIHHGDGVEEAFYLSDRVMTLSFHKFGDYFPGTGSLDDTGIGKGKYRAMNFPLQQGMDDQSFEEIFKPVVLHALEYFQPEAFVMQCGGDSLSGDRLGCFNLSIKGHGACVKFVKSLGRPMLVVGGGGYTLRNVPRCWAYEISLLIDQELENGPKDMPTTLQYYDYYAPEYKLHLPVSNMENQNSKDELNRIMTTLLQNLKNVGTSLTSGIQISNLNDRNVTYHYFINFTQRMDVELPEYMKEMKDKKEDEQKE